MSELAIIGGTGLTSLAGLEIVRREVVHTPFGAPSGPLIHGTLHNKEVVFLARHGYGHTIPPHKVNYRANIWALNHIGVKDCIAVAAVGGIAAQAAPQALVIPDQIIDYTWSRGHTFFEDGLSHVVHAEFGDPYCANLRDCLLQAADCAGIEVVRQGTYGATQGPRLETAAEVRRLARDGCDIVGMTGMPEAGLARELDLCYAACAVVANVAAGLGDRPIAMADIDANLKLGMRQVRTLLQHVIELI